MFVFEKINFYGLFISNFGTVLQKWGKLNFFIDV